MALLKSSIHFQFNFWRFLSCDSVFSAEQERKEQIYLTRAKNTCYHPYRHGNSYPSGLLAIVVVVTREYGRVCIVYDDSDAPSQPVRAIFQSDGKATCYHSNGNIWYIVFIFFFCKEKALIWHYTGNKCSLFRFKLKINYVNVSLYSKGCN